LKKIAARNPKKEEELSSKDDENAEGDEPMGPQAIAR